MGVRVDRPGTTEWDYHTTGAKIGIRSAAGRLKRTASTKEYETSLSRREYLFDASFLVALHGAADLVAECVKALKDPAWPPFLGRKCCIPSEPIFEGVGTFDGLQSALSSVPWLPRIPRIDMHESGQETQTLPVYLEHPQGSLPPQEAQLVYDVPLVFGFYNHMARWVIPGQVAVSVGESTQLQRKQRGYRRVDYTSDQWNKARNHRLATDHYLCVFCKSPADEVHHVSYANVGSETDDDLRSLCLICHKACTMLEYSQGGHIQRIDPQDVALREDILFQIGRILDESRPGRRRELMKSIRGSKTTEIRNSPGTANGEDL